MTIQKETACNEERQNDISAVLYLESAALNAAVAVRTLPLRQLAAHHTLPRHSATQARAVVTHLTETV